MNKEDIYQFKPIFLKMKYLFWTFQCKNVFVGKYLTFSRKFKFKDNQFSTFISFVL